VEAGSAGIEFAEHYCEGRAPDLLRDALRNRACGSIDVVLKLGPEQLANPRSIDLAHRLAEHIGVERFAAVLLHNPERLLRPGEWGQAAGALADLVAAGICREAGLACWTLLNTMTLDEVIDSFESGGPPLALLEAPVSLVQPALVRDLNSVNEIRAQKGLRICASGIFDGGWLPTRLDNSPIPKIAECVSGRDVCIRFALAANPDHIVVAATDPLRTAELVVEVMRSVAMPAAVVDRLLSLV
jgi:aryl-alcohol dehydrogenase-like predicted oxidoreductase